jgi:dipeptidase E
MGKIIAIGGGEIGRPKENGKGNYPVETTAIDKEIIKLTAKKHPKLLFVPTASGDSESYYSLIQSYFGKRLGCETDVVFLKKIKYSQRVLERKVLDSDIIYVGGGNTLTMMKVWKRTGFDSILKKAYEKGIILSGVSAGAICWFRYGNSDSWLRNYGDYIRVGGLDLFNILLCPHYNAELKRVSSLKKMMKKNSGIAVAIDNCCALEIVDTKYRIISSKNKANAYRVYWKNGKYHKEKINKNRLYLPITDLLRK